MIQPGYRLRLNTGEFVTVINKLRHFHSNKLDFIVEDAQGVQYVISEKELSQLTVKKRSTDEKLRLYMEYFAGRTDVLAQKWSNGKGYSPALRNWYAFYQTRNNPENQQQLTKQYLPYTKKVVYDQISSSDAYHRYGIYPLLPNDCTKLLAFDLDKHTSTLDPDQATKSIVDTCSKYHLDCLPEISSSGNSFHVWIFFAEPIKAKLARQLGKLLLMSAMMDGEGVDLSCFDRLIPAQDHLPKKGFGNLIALPLKWSDVKDGKSIFTDRNLQPTDPDQLFDQLEKTKKYSGVEIENSVNQIIADLGLMPGVNQAFDLSQFQSFPKEVTGYIGGQLFIRRSNLTRKEQLALLGLATFQNPEFIKKQKMRMPVWDVPSMLTAGAIDGQYLCLPRGILNEIKVHSSCHLTTQFTEPSSLKVEFNGRLRPQQTEAVKALGDSQLGIICAHTGFGKTIVGCNLIAKRHLPTLIIVPTVNIARQWQQTALKFLSIDGEPFLEKTATGKKVKKQRVEIINGTRNHPSRLVDIVNIRKLGRMSSQERARFYQSYGQIIIDECHHISAVTFEKVLDEANVKYIVGLTATLERSDGLQRFVSYRCGQVKYQSSEEADVLIHRYLYTRYTSIGETEGFEPSLTYAKKVTLLENSGERNREIVGDAVNCLKQGRHILLLSTRVKHLQILAKMLRQSFTDCPIYLVHGGASQKELKIKDTKAAYILLSTNTYVGEGFDLPSLDTLFFALPFSWKGNTQQYLGRLERGLDKKDELRVFDYVDIADPMFGRMFQKRARVYKQDHYEFVAQDGKHSYRSAYLTKDDYLPIWLNDVRKGKEIVVTVKQVSRQLIETVNHLAMQGKKITVVLAKKDEGQKLRFLSSVTIKSGSDLKSNVCVIDRHVCWYGNINFAGRSFKDSSAIRLLNQEVARKLLRNCTREL